MTVGQEVTRAGIAFDAAVARGIGMVSAANDPMFLSWFAEMAYRTRGSEEVTVDAYRLYAKGSMLRMGIVGPEHDRFGPLHELLVDAVADLLSVALEFGLDPDDVVGTALGHVHEERDARCP